MSTPVQLPLDYAITRCLAAGRHPTEPCDRATHCARHMTIEHDTDPVPAYNRACGSELMAAYIPITGFVTEDDAA